MDKKKVGKFLKRLREKKERTQYQVAMDLADYGIEISVKTVAKWEKGNFPDMDKLNILAEYYGVKVSDVLNGEVYISQNFEDTYFTVNYEWYKKYSVDDDLYSIHIEQENKIKSRVKELLITLIENKSLTAMQNEELNFLLKHFYSISDYAARANSVFENDGSDRIKLLRREIYREILSMHDSSVEEIYWEIKKLFNYDKRVTFRQMRGYEANIMATEALLRSIEDWEKDLLLAQIQTQNIADFYDKLTYLKHYGNDYDEERVTKEGIKLLIKCGAKLNLALLGYTQHRYEHFSILNRMETLHTIVDAKIPITKYNDATNSTEIYWAENNTKNRLINLYYMLNCGRHDNQKISFDEIYSLFINNETIPESLLIKWYGEHKKINMSDKELLLQCEYLAVGEIESWRKNKEREKMIEAYREELQDLEEQWNIGKQKGTVEFEEWIGEEDGVLTENDILSRLSSMSYSQYVAGRNTELTIDLLANIDNMSLEEIRLKYFPVEKRYEKL